MSKRLIPLVAVLALLGALLVVPAYAADSELRSIYDGNLTNTESSMLSHITLDKVKSAGLSSYMLWCVVPWLYEQAGIDVEFQGGYLNSQGAISNIFYQPSGSNFSQVRASTYATDVQKYFLKQFTGLRGGNVRFQSASEVTYSNFDWFVGDLFVGMYHNGSVKYQYVALYQGRDFLEFCVGSDGSSSVFYSEMRDIFSRTYNYYAVIRPQALSGEWDVINYNDFTGNMYVDGTNDIITLELPADLCGIQVNGTNGETLIPGQTDCVLHVSNSGLYGAGVYYPGSYITYNVLDLSNIPNGSKFTSSGSVFFEAGSWQYGEELLDGECYVAVQYYDDEFDIIGNQSAVYKDFSLDHGSAEYGWEESITVDAPSNAVYCVYLSRVNITSFVSASRTSAPVFIDFDVSSLQMSISSLYRQEEQTGKQNELLDKIVNGSVTPEPPSGSDSVGDLDDLEDGLKDNTASGREEAEKLFYSGSGIIAAHLSAFLFLADVIERMLDVGWLRGITIVSLSLGILGFLANIAMVAGRNVRDGSKSKSSKGG